MEVYLNAPSRTPSISLRYTFEDIFVLMIRDCIASDLPSVVPGALENFLNLLNAQASNLRDHQIHIDQAHKAPPRKEEESPPVVSSVEKVRNGEFNCVDEQPVERLTNRTAKGSNPVRLELATEDIR